MREEEPGADEREEPGHQRGRDPAEADREGEQASAPEGEDPQRMGGVVEAGTRRLGQVLPRAAPASAIRGPCRATVATSEAVRPATTSAVTSGRTKARPTGGVASTKVPDGSHPGSRVPPGGRGAGEEPAEEGGLHGGEQRGQSQAGERDADGAPGGEPGGEPDEECAAEEREQDAGPVGAELAVRKASVFSASALRRSTFWRW